MRSCMMTLNTSAGMSRTAAAIFAAALFTAAPALADDIHDGQAWLNVTATGSLKGKLMGWGEVQARFGNDVSRLSQSIIRPGIGYQVNKDLILWVGYGRITNHNIGPDVGEDRLWQQVSWTAGKLGRATVSTRTRMEQRFVETGSDTGWRLRHLFKYDLPLREGGTTNFVITSETFIALDDTDWGARAGFDQIRNFVGLGFKVAPKARLEAGYMNQYIDRRGPTDQMNHIASANLLVRY